MESQIADEMLLQQYHEGDSKAVELLMDRYKGLVLHNAKSLFLIGGDTDDLIQEGMIGLFRAIQTFDLERGVTFFTFAQTCIQRQQWKAVEAANRKKNQPLNEAVSIETMEALHADDPEKILLDVEQVNVLLDKINSVLSPMEQQVLAYYLEDDDYRKIAKRMKKEPKSINNAIQRIRKKIRTYIVQGKQS